MKAKILVIADVPGWALERTADNVIARLSGQYDFEKAFNKNAVEKIRAGNFDLLYIAYETQFQDAGIDVEVHHHEVGTAGQAEFDLRYDTLTKMADNVLWYKYIAKNVAVRNGCTVTFMPATSGTAASTTAMATTSESVLACLIPA